MVIMAAETCTVAASLRAVEINPAAATAAGVLAALLRCTDGGTDFGMFVMHQFVACVPGKTSEHRGGNPQKDTGRAGLHNGSQGQASAQREGKERNQQAGPRFTELLDIRVQVAQNAATTMGITQPISTSTGTA